MQSSHRFTASFFVRCSTALIISALMGCSGLKTRSELESGRDSSGRPAPVGSSGSHTGGMALPPPVQVKMPKVGLILGPGGAKAYAHAGVLKEFEKAKIPIHSIIGLEWGSLVAALYATNGSVNDMEWKLYKLDRKELASKGFFGTRDAGSIQNLKKYLQENTGSAAAGRTRVKFACPSTSLRGGTVLWQDQGSLSSAVEACLPLPPLFQMDKNLVASAFSVTDAAEKLKQMGAELIIFVNVLDRGDLFSKAKPSDDPVALLWYEIRNQMNRSMKLMSETVYVTTREFPVDGFENQRQLVQAGQQAGEGAARRLADKYGF